MHKDLKREVVVLRVLIAIILHVKVKTFDQIGTLYRVTLDIRLISIRANEIPCFSQLFDCGMFVSGIAQQIANACAVFHSAGILTIRN